MSKRSSRRKHRQQQKQKIARLSADTLVQQGRLAWQEADYDQAIKAWELARNKADAPPKITVALAEAHFRRAVSGPTSGVADLRQASKLQPADGRYRYHLALAYHRQGEFSQAESLYRQLLAETPPFKRAALPLAQLLVEQKKSPTTDAVWSQLSPTEQSQIRAIEALLNHNVTHLKPLVPSLDPLWAGLVALTLSDQTTARQELQLLVDQPETTHPLLGAVAHHYLGVIAAQQGQMENALTEWQAAQTAGLNSSPLRQNLAVLLYEQALAALQAGQPQQAADLSDQLKLNGLTSQLLSEFKQRLNLDLGYAAAQQDDWSRAVAYWQRAEQNGDDSRRLIFNLALAYQKTEQFSEAAQYWRTLLRRRPRKADHPEALTEAQVARIWQNIAENYGKAGDYEEAIVTYKNAVKYAPDNVELRLKLVEAYQTEGRWQAAENELQRILEKEPDHVPALTLLAESYSQGYYPAQARRLWQRILELEPQNPVARQQLALSYLEEGSRYSLWGEHKRAIAIYQEGLKYVPDSQRLLVMIGGTYAEWRKLKSARQYLAQALALNPNDLQTLHTTYRIWLEFGTAKDLAQTFAQLKAVTTPIPGSFFLDLYRYCLDFDKDQEGLQILAYAEAHYPDDQNLLVGIATGYLNLGQENQALVLLHQVTKNDPDHIEANLQLGILYHKMGQTRLAKRCWEQAAGQARRTHDHLMLHKIKIITDELLYGKPPPRNPLEMFRNMPPEVFKQMLKTAPPEIAALLQDMDLEMLEVLLKMAGPDDFDEEEDFFI
jgi:tetratricopeptide (TPR) repeat protein